MPMCIRCTLTKGAFLSIEAALELMISFAMRLRRKRLAPRTSRYCLTSIYFANSVSQQQEEISEN